MLEAPENDYKKMSSMIFGGPPTFAEVLASVDAVHKAVNQA